jgi:hypothetical protein
MHQTHVAASECNRVLYNVVFGYCLLHFGGLFWANHEFRHAYAIGSSTPTHYRQQKQRCTSPTTLTMNSGTPR